MRRPAAAPYTGDADYKPTKAGGGGPLKLIFWQGPTVLNAHFSTGTKDIEAARIFLEPLAGWDDDGNLVPILAAEIPSTKNGLLAADGTSVTWKIKPGVKWHDGQPLTADDLVFNWQFIKDPAAACVTVSAYRDITVEKIDDLTVKVVFPAPTPFWANAFVGRNGPIMPQARLRRLHRATSRATRPPTSCRSARALTAASSSARATRCGASASSTITSPTGPTSIPSSSRAAATPSRRRVPFCRPATTTSARTSRSRTRC